MEKGITVFEASQLSLGRNVVK